MVVAVDAVARTATVRWLPALGMPALGSSSVAALADEEEVLAFASAKDAQIIEPIHQTFLGTGMP
jgi:hypothetical protein